MVTVETFDRVGMPVRCECSLCGLRWTRPAGDPEAKTLVGWARTHHCTGRLLTGDRSLLLSRRDRASSI
jgi:hypothetical protein